MSWPPLPDKVQRQAVISFCTEIGLDANLVAGLEFTVYGVYVNYYATDSEGHRLSDGSGPALHRVYIPLDNQAKS